MVGPQASSLRCKVQNQIPWERWEQTQWNSTWNWKKHMVYIYIYSYIITTTEQHMLNFSFKLCAYFCWFQERKLNLWKTIRYFDILVRGSMGFSVVAKHGSLEKLYYPKRRWDLSLSSPTGDPLEVDHGYVEFTKIHPVSWSVFFPNHPFVHRGFPIIFTIHFGVPVFLETPILWSVWWFVCCFFLRCTHVWVVLPMMYQNERWIFS